MLKTRLALLAMTAAFSLPAAAPVLAQQASAAGFAQSDASDPYLWLEEVEGERAMAWVRQQNEASLGTLQGDPRYQGLHDQALTILEARDRIPMPGFATGLEGEAQGISNFWQDATNVRGLWRMTTVDSYLTDQPDWTTVIDVDALSKAENANWVWRGAQCLSPADRMCLVTLSDGGKDAVTVREFDRETRTFVEGGFVLPESKGGATWVDADTLLISRDFGEGTLTTSGYPMTVRLWKRGAPMTAAQEIFRGEPGDVSSSGFTLREPDGTLRATLITRAVTFYERDVFQLTSDGTVERVALPRKASISGYVGGRLIVTLNQDWTAPTGQSFRNGDLLAWDLDAALARDAEALRRQSETPVELILRPTERQAIEGVTTTRNRVVVALYDNVRGGLISYAPDGSGGWTATKVDLPENVSVNLGSASDQDDRVFASVSGYLTPQSLWLVDAATGAASSVKSLPAKFDTAGLEVRQFEATSADGTKIPYFVVGGADMAMDGSNPTLLYGYGGFQSSLLPGYSANVGKLWLERGGVYVIANTRGGGEFGPNWHQSAQQENRQRAHEDFQAVAMDLIARGITSPRRLGVMGGSQGGLFMGAILTQRPDLINAAVIQVPLFDMLRFHKLLAGASWIAEYGNPDIAEERAWIAAYSPYQNLRAGQPYPQVFIHTSTKDDRVHPGHARKAAARMQELGYDVLFYENTDGGHAAGANLRETARRLALEYTYLTRRLMD
ncbi:MAG: prolyl oligopeptidase family serine peptidase [Alphaproteobacteria bacterium]|nr:prolyl oligopeptidase family serine peptidase [Alphaproteobacteria bacterium]MBU1527075.1 prolyl oligopeptidase family serine peptidase [Alphaproteobacteria bacterium]MBU2118048.1 prolyl oligopeptidase family serine peptidase [Alphaproteobacteria bacterium]MBU2349999.1 prolyl oligopeptidase family serine peptidase [Alphaproteobacteria bacterium]MBU2382944.1 prolyl oligopeptidase family serine peptidase [Alphaproteobacteria bacterium]